MGRASFGDTGYNDNASLNQHESMRLVILNTTKRGLSLCFTFGKTRSKTAREQCEIPESGPFLSVGATRSIGKLLPILSHIEMALVM